LYAVLRSIPNKLGGLIGFVFAIFILRVLAIVKAKQSLSRIKLFPSIIWWFFSFNLLLMWLGIQPVEEPYIIIGQVITILYFLSIFIILIWDLIIEEILI
jgi:ubiquinol-cytochrome c reductase cytochrome b subunit